MKNLVIDVLLSFFIFRVTGLGLVAKKNIIHFEFHFHTIPFWSFLTFHKQARHDPLERAHGWLRNCTHKVAFNILLLN